MPFCAHPAPAREHLFFARDYITRDRFEIVRCQNCGWVTTWPPPPIQRLERYYPTGYYASGGGHRFPLLVERIQQALDGSRARRVEEANGGRPGRVLDMGCGPGRLLREFRRRGWEVQGMELCETSAAHARDVLKIPLQVGPIDVLPWPAAHFDAVIMWHVLEHLSAPWAALAEVRRVLKPGGIFWGSVPNFGSAEARMAQDHWFHLDVPRHLTHLTPASLGGALKEAGFQTRRLSFFALEYDCFSFTQSALNALGLRQNLLYNLLRGRDAKVFEDAGMLPTWISLLLAAPLGILSVPATALAGWFRSGATMTWLAVKAPAAG